MCVKRASTGLCGGCRVIGIPTATEAGNGGESQGKPKARCVLLYSDINEKAVYQELSQFCLTLLAIDNLAKDGGRTAVECLG